jgi:hypothetical protein
MRIAVGFSHFFEEKNFLNWSRKSTSAGKKTRRIQAFFCEIDWL